MRQRKKCSQNLTDNNTIILTVKNLFQKYSDRKPQDEGRRKYHNYGKVEHFKENCRYLPTVDEGRMNRLEDIIVALIIISLFLEYFGRKLKWQIKGSFSEILQ